MAGFNFRQIILWALVGSLLVTSAQAAEILPLRYAQTASTWRSIFSLPMRIADREGFYAANGLNLTMFPVEGGAESSLVALEEEQADVAHVATSFLITAALRGSDAVAIVAEFNNPVYSLIAKPWYKTIGDLKGRRVGMADMSGAVSLATMALFEKIGLSKDDLDINVIEGTPGRFQCLLRGDCDAVPLGQPQDFHAVRQGFRLLGVTNDAVPDFVYTVTAVRKSWAAANKEVVVRYIRAMGDSFAFIRNPNNRSRIAVLMKEWWGSSEETSLSTLDLFFNPEKNVLPFKGEINLRGVEQVIRFLRDGGVVKGPIPPVETFVDQQYWRAAFPAKGN
jgi:NitT/TauT family transport system substrate-binding protein